MTTYTRSALKTFFETGDIPFGIDYANLIDSCLNIVDTSAQVIASPIQTPELAATRVSATNINITGTLSAKNINVSALTINANSLSVSKSFTLFTIAATAKTVTRGVDTSVKQVDNTLIPSNVLYYNQPTTLGHAYGSTMQIARTADYVGGTVGYVNGGLFVSTSVSRHATSYEWAVTGAIYNAASGGQNVGVYGLGVALESTTGPTWGMVCNGQDQSGAERVGGTTMGIEIDCFGNGPNTLGRNRIGANIVAGTYNNGTPAEIFAGLYFTNYDRAYYNNVIQIGNDVFFSEPAFAATTGIRVTNVSGTTMLWDDAQWVNGIRLEGTYSGDALIVSGKVSATNISITSTLSAQKATITGNVSANAIWVSAAHAIAGVFYATPSIVSATGTTQAAAAPLNAIITRGQGVTDGSTTGFAIPANRTGWIQYFNYESAVSGNLWPPTGGQINNLNANGVYVLNPRTMYQIIHIAASSYAVGSFFSIG